MMEPGDGEQATGFLAAFTPYPLAPSGTGVFMFGFNHLPDGYDHEYRKLL